MIAFEVNAQNRHTEGFWCAHDEWTMERTRRFSSLSEAVCEAMPLIGENDNVTISMVTFAPEKPGHTTTEVMWDFFHGKLRHAARKAA